MELARTTPFSYQSFRAFISGSNRKFKWYDEKRHRKTAFLAFFGVSSRTVPELLSN